MFHFFPSLSLPPQSTNLYRREIFPSAKKITNSSIAPQKRKRIRIIFSDFLVYTFFCLATFVEFLHFTRLPHQRSILAFLLLFCHWTVTSHPLSLSLSWPVAGRTGILPRPIEEKNNSWRTADASILHLKWKCIKLRKYYRRIGRRQ